MASPGVMDVIVDDLVLVLQKKNQVPLQKKNQVTLLSVPNVRHPTLGWAFIVASAFSKHFGWPPSIVSDRRPFVFVFALRILHEVFSPGTRLVQNIRSPVKD